MSAAQQMATRTNDGELSERDAQILEAVRSRTDEGPEDR